MSILSDADKAAVNIASFAIKSVDGIALMVDASTGHLTENDKKVLSEMSGVVGLGNREYFPRTVEHEHGWVLSPSGDYLGSFEDSCEVGISDGLKTLIVMAIYAEAMILNFDAAADYVDGVPVVE